MTILVTGAAGFIGSNFVLDWLALGSEPVVSVDLLTYAGNLRNLERVLGDPRHEFRRGNICDRPFVLSALMERQPRAVINFAAESHVDRSIHAPGVFVETNVLGTFQLLEAVREYLGSLSSQERDAFRLLHVSTDEVYGSLAPDAKPFSEQHAYRPNSPYSASKAASDHFVRAYHHTYGLPVLTTNCSNNYGPFHFPEKLIPLMTKNALAGLSLPVYGDGRQVRDWLFVADHCSAIRTVLARGRVGETYNIGGNSELTNLQVVHQICDLLDELRPRSDGRSYRDQIKFVADRPGHDRRYAIDASKVRDELGWMPEETFYSGLRKTLLWYIANGDWLEEVTSGGYRDWIERNYKERS